MKRPITLVLALLSGALAVWFGFFKGEPKDAPPLGKPSGVPVLPAPTTTSTDAEEVFKRAFWKRPSENDRILHAERREWADGDGVDRWQWFIAVDPSVELATYLNEQNPFSLTEPRSEAAIPAQPRPKWFPDSAEGFTARQSQDGTMLILTREDNGRIFATSQGRGFAKAVEVNQQGSSDSQSAGAQSRLPNTPPPLPEER